jgi:hypothetical protein
MLFGKRGLVLHAGWLRKSRGPDRVGGLMRPLQIARVPDRVARQDFSNRGEDHAVAGIAADILLPVNAAAVLANRRVTHPPPPCRDHAGGNGMLGDEWLGRIGHRKNPSILFDFAVRQRADCLK